MRFDRTRRFPEFTDTSRKRAALRRRQRLNREKYPLLAPLIAETQPDEDTVMAQRAEDWERMEEAMRDRKAENWRRARRRLAATGDNLRPMVLAFWNGHRWFPGDPVNLLDLIHQIETGQWTATAAGGFAPAGHEKLVPVAEVQRRMAALTAEVQARRRAEKQQAECGVEA